MLWTVTISGYPTSACEPSTVSPAYADADADCRPFPPCVAPCAQKEQAIDTPDTDQQAGRVLHAQSTTPLVCLINLGLLKVLTCLLDYHVPNYEQAQMSYQGAPEILHLGDFGSVVTHFAPSIGAVRSHFANVYLKESGQL